MTSREAPRYIAPPARPPLLHRVFTRLAHYGFSVMGCRLLDVRGRVSGELRTALVGVQPYEGERYLVAPRGHTQWVRNLRKAGAGQLRLGRRTEAFTVEELPDSEKLGVLRVYLKRWGFESDTFFEGVRANSPEADLRRIAPNHPIFRIHPQRPAA